MPSLLSVLLVVAVLSQSAFVRAQANCGCPWTVAGLQSCPAECGPKPLCAPVGPVPISVFLRGVQYRQYACGSNCQTCVYGLIAPWKDRRLPFANVNINPIHKQCSKCPLTLQEFQKPCSNECGHSISDTAVPCPTGVKDRGMICKHRNCGPNWAHCCYGDSKSGKFANQLVDCADTLIRNTYVLETGAEVSWVTAQANCVSKYGTNLATIRNPKEQSEAIAIANGHLAWIGFNDRGTEDTFKWVSGDPSFFTSWVEGEPNDLGGEDCVYLHFNGKWNDANCDHVLLNEYLCDATQPINAFP